MSEFCRDQLPVIARRVLAERDAGREVDPSRVKWANDILEFFNTGNVEAGQRSFAMAEILGDVA